MLRQRRAGLWKTLWAKNREALIPRIPRPNLFIHFQDFYLMREEWPAGLRPADAVLEAREQPAGAPSLPSFLAHAYPWIKALHIIAVVSWMAGLLYLPRLFVYHAERGAPGSELSRPSS